MQELQRLTAFYALYSMRENRGTQPKDLYTFPWEREKNNEPPPLSEDEIAELKAEMDAINAGIEEAETT